MGNLINIDSSFSQLSSINSIANENNWRDLIVDNRTNTNIHFNVAIQPLSNHLATPLITNDEQIVIDTDENHIIAVHGSRYELITNKDAFDAVNAAINTLVSNGHLNTNGAHIKDAVVNKGGKVIRQYIFPEHFVEIGKGDKVFLRLVVINSYDGSCGFQVQAGGFRVVCTNGLVSGERFLSLDIRHTGNCDFAKITQKIMTAIKSFDAMGNYWKKMLNTPIEQKQSDFLLTKVATLGNEVNMNKFIMLKDLFKTQVQDLGKNYWAMYNTLTAYSTHYKVSDKSQVNVSDIRLQRENELGKLMRSKDWAVERVA